MQEKIKAAVFAGWMHTLTSTERCKRHRRRILDISQRVQALHIGGAFSCIEIVDACYFDLMRPGDRFVMSKGHGAIAQYVVLEAMGILSTAELDAYCTKGGRLGVHPDRGNPGIEASTGALGHGLAMAVGMAYADRAHTVYCVLSDGECMEGSTWEAVMLAANLRLSNLVCFVDNNDMVSDGRISERWPAVYPLVEKFTMFGWLAYDGDVLDSIERLRSAQEIYERAPPIITICKTIKGSGVSFMENVPMWHYRSPSKAEYEKAMEELA